MKYVLKIMLVAVVFTGCLTKNISTENASSQKSEPARYKKTLKGWNFYPERPDWARRGGLRWLHGFTAWDNQKVDAILDMEFNLVQSGYWAKPKEFHKNPFKHELIKRYNAAHKRGFNWQYYSSSRNILTKEAKSLNMETELVRMNEDSDPLVYYANPKRRAGCWRSLRYQEYVSSGINKMKSEYSGIKTVFMDNGSDLKCGCSKCTEAFKEFTKSQLGRAMSLDDAINGRSKNAPEKTRMRFEALYNSFRVAEGVNFYSYVRKKTDMLLSPNFHLSSFHFGMIEKGASDIVFFEEGGKAPPYDKNFFPYKLALAAGAGRPVGMLHWLPLEEAEKRALKRSRYWENKQPIVSEAFYFKDEYALAMAEAIACNASWIPSWNIMVNKITTSDDEYHSGLRNVLKKYNELVKNNTDIYKNSIPGSDTAILYASSTGLAFRFGNYIKKCQAQAETLIELGIPYEVVVERELKSGIFSNWKTIVLPHTIWLPLEKINALAEFVRDGGTLIKLGKCMEGQEYGKPVQLPEILQGNEKIKNAGKGLIIQLESLEKLKREDMATVLANLKKNVRMHFTSDSNKLSVNSLENDKCLSIHFVNYNFIYNLKAASENVNEIKSDNDTYASAVPITSDKTSLRKILYIPENRTLPEKVFLRGMFGTWQGTFKTTFVINGQKLDLKGNYFRGKPKWIEIPIDSVWLRKGKNVIDIKLSGNINGANYLMIGIDSNDKLKNSFVSQDGGTNWSNNDLSQFKKGKQKGELMIRISPESLSDVLYKPEDFRGKLQVKPAKNITFYLNETTLKEPKAILILPDAKAREIKSIKTSNGFSFEIPEVDVYAVLKINKDIGEKK